MIVIAVSLFQQPAFVAFVIGVPALVGSALLWQRGRQTDAVAKQVSIATVETGSIGGAVEGFNQLVERLQEDNGVLRTEIVNLRNEIRQLRVELSTALTRLEGRTK